MSKKTFWLISLIFTILFLLYSVMDYYGYIRYYKVCGTSMNKLLENYKNVDKYDKNKVVVILGIKNYDNISGLEKCIKSILNQNIRIDEIGINIPYKEIGKIPGDLKKIVSIHSYSKDCDQNDLVYTLLREPEKNTKIIIINYLRFFGYDYLQNFIDESNKEENSIISMDENGKYVGNILIKPEFFSNVKSEKGICESMETWLRKYSKNNIHYTSYKDNFNL